MTTRVFARFLVCANPHCILRNYDENKLMIVLDRFIFNAHKYIAAWLVFYFFFYRIVNFLRPAVHRPNLNNLFPNSAHSV